MPEPLFRTEICLIEILIHHGNVTYEYLTTITAQGDGYGLDAPVFYTWNTVGILQDRVPVEIHTQEYHW